MLGKLPEKTYRSINDVAVELKAITLSNIFLGTSGWSYKEWEGNFYQKGTGQSKLRAYSRVFKTAEIDSTFYRNPSKGTVMGWLKYSPSDFVFTAKLPKTITHDKALGLKKDVKADLEQFLDLMRPLQLGGKLGCLLIQLPPKYSYNPQNLEAFFELLDPVFRYAVEFRNLSWLVPETETFELLKKYRVAYTVVDEPLLPPEVHLTADFAYFRWHGHGERIWFDYRYSKEQLEEWAPKDPGDRWQSQENLWLLQQSLPRLCAGELPAVAGAAGFADQRSRRRRTRKAGLSSQSLAHFSAKLLSQIGTHTALSPKNRHSGVCK